MVFEKSTEVLLLMRDDGIAIDCNPAAVQLLGCTSKTEIIGHHGIKFWPKYQPDGRRSVDAAEIVFNQVKAKGNFSFEWVHQCADGTPLHVEALLTAIELEG